MSKFMHHPDGYVVVNDGAGKEYLDDVSNFKLDFNLPNYSFNEPGFIGRIYEPGVKHALMKKGGQEPKPMPWALGDNILAALDDGLTAKDLRENPPLSLTELKKKKLIELSGMASQEVFKGFTSNALGSMHRYEAMFHNQINLLGVIVAGVDVNYTCTKLSDNSKKQRLHTVAELQQVFSDGMTYMTSIWTYYDQLRVDVDACTTQTQLDAIAWNYI